MARCWVIALNTRGCVPHGHIQRQRERVALSYSAGYICGLVCGMHMRGVAIVLLAPKVLIRDCRRL